jgi:hypothetical protein
MEVLTIIADVVQQVDQGQPRYRPAAWTRISRPQSERAAGAAGCSPLCLAATVHPAAAKTRFFPLPMYTTVPNEGSTYGAMPVFMVADDDDPDRVKSITAPSVSWNTSAGVTGTYRYYRYFEVFRSWHLLLSASTTINRSVWFTYDDARRTPRALTFNLLARVRRNLFYRYWGLGPNTTPEAESSYTRLFAIASGRVGWNLTSNLNLGVYGEVRGDRPEEHAIKGLPATQTAFPDAPGLDGSALVRGGLQARYDTRTQGDYSPGGFAAELSADVGHGITGLGWIGQFSGTARVLVPELSFLQGAARFYWMQVVGNDVPFYDQASLGGEVLFRGFPENRFIDMGAWEVELEQRSSCSRLTSGVGRLAHRPLVAAGQVYGQTALGRVRAGLRDVFIHPDILARRLGYAGEGLRAYVVLGYPY